MSARARAQLYTVGVACIVSISSIAYRSSALKLLHKRSFILALGIAGTGHTHNQPEENLNGRGRYGPGMCVHVQKNAYMCVKKSLCPELGLNCCTSASRSELLPTGLVLIGVD